MVHAYHVTRLQVAKEGRVSLARENECAVRTGSTTYLDQNELVKENSSSHVGNGDAGHDDERSNHEALAPCLENEIFVRGILTPAPASGANSTCIIVISGIYLDCMRHVEDLKGEGCGSSLTVHRELLGISAVCAN